LGEGVEDEGDMEVYLGDRDGGEGSDGEEDDGYGVVQELELESGVGSDPDTGAERVYRELWALRTMRGNVGERVCVVLRTAEEVEGDVRGIVVRIGGLCQGILKRNSGEMEVGRWRFGKGWEMIVGVGVERERGGLRAACEAAMAFEETKLTEGKEVEIGVLKWKVEEVTVW